MSQHRFGVVLASWTVYTRTGRRFFTDERYWRRIPDASSEAVSRRVSGMNWETDWLCLDCEFMPWSAKAQELLRQQYAPVGTAGLER